jgi:integrase/recombinase XerD
MGIWDFLQQKNNGTQRKNKSNKKHPNHTDLNLLLQKKLYQANKAIIELDEKGDPYSVEDIVIKLKPNSTTITVFKYTEDLIKKLKRTGKIGNAIVYQTTLNALKKFRKDIDLNFNHLSYIIIQNI